MSDNLLWGVDINQAKKNTPKEYYYDFVEKSFLLLKQKLLRCYLIHFHLLTVLSKEDYRIVF